MNVNQIRRTIFNIKNNKLSTVEEKDFRRIQLDLLNANTFSFVVNIIIFNIYVIFVIVFRHLEIFRTHILQNITIFLKRTYL